MTVRQHWRVKHLGACPCNNRDRRLATDRNRPKTNQQFATLRPVLARTNWVVIRQVFWLRAWRGDSLPNYDRYPRGDGDARRAPVRSGSVAAPNGLPITAARPRRNSTAFPFHSPTQRAPDRRYHSIFPAACKQGSGVGIIGPKQRVDSSPAAKRPVFKEPDTSKLRHRFANVAEDAITLYVSGS
jgi:hypothetical protein